MDEKIIDNPELLLTEWANHFSQLAQSRKESFPSLEKLQCKVDKLASDPDLVSTIRDLPEAQKVTKAVSRLKLRNAASPRLMGEYLRAVDDSLVIWLMNVSNSVVKLEAVPDILKMGILIPVYTGVKRALSW